MSTAFVPVTLAPAVHYSNGPSQPEHAPKAVYSSYRSPASTSSQSSHPTPPPANGVERYQTHMNGYHPNQGSNHMYRESGYSQSPLIASQVPDWHTSSAGPSRQRTSRIGMSSPMSITDSYDGSRSIAMKAQGSHGPGSGQGGRESRLGRDGEVDDGRVGVEDPRGERSYTELKCLGDGSFGTVWLCDWHSPVKPNVLLSAMQCGAGARPEWAGKRLVALKRMKRVWEGGWKQAKTLGELVSLSRIPPHPAIIPLYDAFISPKSRELYFVFECMEGNLYQLTKSRRGRPLAAGLIASCFHQISSGLYHIHRHGYFHRDMKPENLLVTTTGLTDYLTPSALIQVNSTRNGMTAPDGHISGEPLRYEKDVAVIVKLADFGLARATDSKPPYTEYVSTRWYRAPEVLLRSTDYGAPVDMWALGTILAEMVNLKPLFPGVSEIDQVFRICSTMGDPSSGYGVDKRGKTIGGGSWNTGIKLAKNVGFSFPKREPVPFRSLFAETVPESLVDCIRDLLLYNPKYRMTAAQCVDHPYFHETLPHLQRTPPLPRIPFAQGQPAPGAIRSAPLELAAAAAAPRQVPPSHAHTPHEHRPAFADGDMRTLPPPMGTPDSGSPGGSRVMFPHHPHMQAHRMDPRAYHEASALVHQLRELDLPTDDLASYGIRPPPSPGAPSREPSYLLSPVQTIDPRSRSQQWASEVALSTHPATGPQSTLYDGSVFEGSQNAANSSPSFVNYSNSSVNDQVTNQYIVQPKPHVTAYVQQQQRYAEETPRQAASPQMPMPPPIEPTIGAARAEKLAVTGKKKKWGLSSVFGGADKSTTELHTVSEAGYAGSSLKRTQSGNRPPERAQLSPVITDPKKAKKEAEKAAKEYEKAKREAAANLQKERARAVLQKRSQLIEARNQTHTKTELEFASANVNDPAMSAPKNPLRQASGMVSASTTMVNKGLPGSSLDLREYAGGPGSTSLASVRSHESGQSGRSGLSAAALKAYDESHGVGRHKARRRDDDDDHSMSSFGQHSLMSRSVLTVGTTGTVDSDPGPRRRHEWQDPLRTRDSSKRAPSMSSSYKPSGGMSRSNASLESQLAHDFKTHANVGATPSSASLGRLGQASSSLSLHAQLDQGGYQPSRGNGSVPTSPYGHPKAAAVAHGHGLGRQPVGSVPMLPSISSWEGSGVGSENGSQGHINPMFRVPSATNASQAGQGTTLPPFSAIASVAGREHSHGHGQGQ
ncbi:hypothetical protein IAU60_003078 [Kwoniella sp. DSM 27419]